MKFFPLLLASATLAAADASNPIARLASPDIAIRRAAIEEIQTLEDPAIPAACLPLLRDEGRSIRRQAARAIGSRFADVPPDQRKIYLAALRDCAAAGPEANTLLCQRAIGLLTRNYAFPSFSVGPKKKWILYERRKLPVIAPYKDGPHQLLSLVAKNTIGERDLPKLAVTNESAQDLFAPHWHPGGDAVAFTMILQRRFFNPICIWVAGEESVKVLEPQSLKPLLPAHYPAWGTTSEFVKWDGEKAIVRIYDCDTPDGLPDPPDPGVLISYDIRTRQLARVEK